MIALTPVSLAVFGYLARKGKEPSAPRKIGIGMMIAVCGFLIMAIGSIGLPTPDALAASGIEKDALVSPHWLISTYLWGGMQLWMVLSVLIVCCLLAALFIFSIMKKLEKVA